VQRTKLYISKHIVDNKPYPHEACNVQL